jgi:hypothetical protein
LGIASRSKIRYLSELAPGDPLEEMWISAQKLFFQGADEDEMLDLVKTLDKLVRHREVNGSMRRVLSFTLERLEQNDVVIVGFSNKLGHGGHWVLAVGVELLADGTKVTPTGVLCLDPSEPAPSVASYNAKLDLTAPFRGARCIRYRVPDGGVHTVTCDSAIGLSVRR